MIKQFFSISGLSCILGVNLSALENSVKARYGNDIDASAYSHKFVNVSKSLPAYIGQSNDQESVEEVYLQDLMKAMDTPAHLRDLLVTHIKVVMRNNDVSIRDEGKILAAINLLHGDILTNDRLPFGWQMVAITLVVSKIIRPDLFSSFVLATISDADLEAYFDARPSLIDKSPNVKNAEYDHSTWISFQGWRYLTSNGEPNFTENLNYFANCFSSSGYRGNSQSILQRVHAKYIDLFKT